MRALLLLAFASVRVGGLLGGEAAIPADPDPVREYLSTGCGLQFSAEIYRSKREKTVFHEYLQGYCFVLTEISENIWKPLWVYGRM